MNPSVSCLSFLSASTFTAGAVAATAVHCMMLSSGIELQAYYLWPLQETVRVWLKPASTLHGMTTLDSVTRQPSACWAVVLLNWFHCCLDLLTHLMVPLPSPPAPPASLIVCCFPKQMGSTSICPPITTTLPPTTLTTSFQWAPSPLVAPSATSATLGPPTSTCLHLEAASTRLTPPANMTTSVAQVRPMMHSHDGMLLPSWLLPS